MKREIKFRGKTHKGDWAFGFIMINKDFITKKDYFYIHQIGEHSGSFAWAVEVIPETVGQYIGLKDKSENRIYEGDIVDKWSDGKELIEIEFENAIYLMQEGVLSDSCTIVGNIYDNPELTAE